LRKFSACACSVDEKLQSIELRHAIDQIGNSRTEAFDQLRLLDAAVFDHVVQQCSLDRSAVETPFGQYLSDCEWMRDVGGAAATELPEMRFVRKPEALP
jgi:hypothetical protein